MRKPPKLPHVKYVRKARRWYAYFNTGQKRDGRPIYHPMPEPFTLGFHDSYASLCAGRTKRQSTTFTVAHLAEEFRRSRELASKAENTQSLYRSQLARIVEFWGEFPVDELEPADVRLVLDNENWNAGTHNAVLAVLAVLYKWARRANKAKAWPTKDIDRMQGGQHSAWPEHVVEAALRADDPLVRLSVHLLYFTGLRIGDACKLLWSNVSGGAIHVTPQKTRRFRKHLEIPLLNELAAELDRTPRTGMMILGGVGHSKLRDKLQAFTRTLGVETVPHGLRKNAVNVLLEAGSTIAEVAAITGQAFQIVEHYAAQVNQRKLGKAAIVKLEAHRNKSA